MSPDPVAAAAPRVGTYRLQLGPDFDFAAATKVLPYLARLGISHVYLSPCFEARAGSTHGYDIVDPWRIRAELGGPDAYRTFSAEASRLGLAQILDIVPHHMSTAGDQNPWWWDVLKLGRRSRYASHFDIDWDPPERKLRDTVLLPVLDDHFGRVLEAGDLAVEWTEAGEFEVRYHDVVAPLSPTSMGTILEGAARRAASDELGFVARALHALNLTDADIRTAGRQVARLAAQQPDVAAAIDFELDALNRDKDALDDLLSRQHHRLARWQVGSQELDYRRFFDITGLVALRSERAEVFRDSHVLAGALVADGSVAGLRVDHPDGLADPQGYFDRLRALTGPHTWLLGEKIRRPHEQLPDSWAADGTTGYDFLGRAGDLFVDPAGVERLREVYAAFAGEARGYDEIALESRREMLQDRLAADLARVTALLVEVCERHRRYRDFTRVELREAVASAVACLPVYRTYVGQEPGAEADRAAIATALERVRQSEPEVDPDLLALLAELLSGRMGGDVEAAFVRRFQQLAPPVAAKGEEDTAFYRYAPLLSLNEVGSDPDRSGITPTDFHAEQVQTHARWPYTMVTTSTHDTKRSEDVRARLALLSEIPDEWERTVQQWATINDPHRSAALPDRKVEWFFYQTVLGAHPLPLDRAWTVMEKSIREANEHTSWMRTNGEYEAAVRRFVEGSLGDPAFTDALDGFVRRLDAPGKVNALAQAALKLLSPGVPDTYQGTELWDNSLVDPDNRRPVDFDLRHRLLEQAAEWGERAGLLAWSDHRETGLPKLVLTTGCLAVRRRHPGAFDAGGTYEPIEVEGPESEHVVAFVRGGAVAAVVPRLVLSLDGAAPKASVQLPGGSWQNLMTGERVGGGQPVDVRELWGDSLDRFPVAILERG